MVQFGREQAYKLFPMDINDIPRGLFTPMRYKLSPPTIHLGYLVSDEKLTDAARHLRCVSWVQKDHPPPPWDESKGPDEQPIHTRLELFIDEFVTKGNVSEVLRDEFGVPQARLTRVCMKNPDESHQLLSLFTSTNEPNHMPSLKDIMSVAEIFGIDDPPAWYPDYMWGDWRARTNEKSFIDPVCKLITSRPPFKLIYLQIVEIWTPIFICDILLSVTGYNDCNIPSL